MRKRKRTAERGRSVRGPRFEVYDSGKLLLSFVPEPGLIISSEGRPIEMAPRRHPFLNARTHDQESEHRIVTLLAGVASASEFVNVLRTAGFEVRSMSYEIDPPVVVSEH